jgi:hypothetical protein
MKAEDFLRSKKIGQTFVSTKDKNGYIALTDLLEEFLKVNGQKMVCTDYGDFNPALVEVIKPKS